jgi:hypothetical protein
MLAAAEVSLFWSGKYQKLSPSPGRGGASEASPGRDQRAHLDVDLREIIRRLQQMSHRFGIPALQVAPSAQPVVELDRSIMASFWRREWRLTMHKSSGWIIPGLLMISAPPHADDEWKGPRFWRLREEFWSGEVRHPHRQINTPFVFNAATGPHIASVSPPRCPLRPFNSLARHARTRAWTAAAVGIVVTTDI